MTYPSPLISYAFYDKQGLLLFVGTNFDIMRITNQFKHNAPWYSEIDCKKTIIWYYTEIPKGHYGEPKYDKFIAVETDR